MHVVQNKNIIATRIGRLYTIYTGLCINFIRTLSTRAPPTNSSVLQVTNSPKCEITVHQKKKNSFFSYYLPNGGNCKTNWN